MKVASNKRPYVKLELRVIKMNHEGMLCSSVSVQENTGFTTGGFTDGGEHNGGATEWVNRPTSLFIITRTDQQIYVGPFELLYRLIRFFSVSRFINLRIFLESEFPIGGLKAQLVCNI